MGSSIGMGAFNPGSDQELPISRKRVLTNFLSSLTDDALDKLICLVDIYTI